MGLLTEAVIEQSAIKAAIFGPQGSSKSLTAFLIAIGLSKLHHDSAPIAMHDTEDASDWLIPIAETEGVRFIRHKSTAFVDMVAVLKEAEKEGACVYIQDVVSRTWKELQDTYMRKKDVKRLEFQHWNELKSEWQRQYVDRYLASPLHCFVLGRLGYEYDAVEDDQGKRSQERVGTKMKAEGEFGYEPHLLLEMEGRRVIPPSEEGEGRKKKRRVRKQGGQFEYYAHVLKDRSRALNATAIRLPNVNNYKPGDYRKIYDLFAPHWALMKFGQAHRGLDVDKSSGDLFDAPNGRSLYADRQRRKDIVLEEVQAMLVKVWPGQDAASKQAKQSAIKQLFDVYAWRSVEEKSLEEIERALAAMQKFVTLAETKPPANHDAAIDLLAECRDAVNEERAPAEIGVVAPEDAAVI
jgi:hypothetical protein